MKFSPFFTNLEKPLKVPILSYIAFQSPNIRIHGLYHGIFKRYLQNFDTSRILDFMKGQTWNYSIKCPDFGNFLSFKESPKALISGLHSSSKSRNQYTWSIPSCFQILLTEFLFFFNFGFYGASKSTCHKFFGNFPHFLQI